MQNLALILPTPRDDYMHAISVLVYLLGVPPIERAHVRDLGGTLPEHGLSCILRQPLVVGEVEGPDELPLKPVVGIAPQQGPIRRQSTNAKFAWNGSRCTQLLLRTPEIEML